MNTATELLDLALRRLESYEEECGADVVDMEVMEEIRAFLSTPSDDAEEIVAWVDDKNQIWGNGYAIKPGDKLYHHPPKPAEPEVEYDLSEVIPLTHRKAKGIIKDNGYHVTGFVLSRPDGDKCIVDMSAVRWLTGKEFFEMMHPPVVSPTAEPEAGLCHHSLIPGTSPVLWKCTSCGHEYMEEKSRPEPARKPMTEEEIDDESLRLDCFRKSFGLGIRFAEKHHGIGGEA